MNYKQLALEVLKDSNLIKTLSQEDLLGVKDVLEKGAVEDNVGQNTRKIQINSVYGAQANKHFLAANPDLAAAITACGRFIVQLVSHRINERLQELSGRPDIEFVIYNDTDSVAPDTAVIVNGEEMTIEDLFNGVGAEIEISQNGHEIKRCRNLITPTYDENGLSQRDVRYVMRHMVKKKHYRVTACGKSVTITGDHSLKVLRDGKIIDARVCDLKPTDMVIMITHKGAKLVSTSESPIKKMLKAFEGVKFIPVDELLIEDLGDLEGYVYDIEVEGTHAFFANDFLVHNSAYYSADFFVSRRFGENADPHDPEVVDWVDRFEKKVIQPTIQSAIDEYAQVVNAYEPATIGADREIIADSAVFAAKKKYFARVQDAEGVRYSVDNPYIKVMGLEIAKASTPPFVKKKLNESIPVILDSTEAGLRAWRDVVKLEFAKQPIESICMVQGISNVTGDLSEKGLPQGTKSAIAHNNWVKNNGLENEIPLLEPGEKYKRCYLLEPNRFGAEVISFNDPKIAKIIEEDGIYDFARNFQLQFEQPLERMVEGMNWDIEDKPTFGNLEDW